MAQTAMQYEAVEGGGGGGGARLQRKNTLPNTATTYPCRGLLAKLVHHAVGTPLGPEAPVVESMSC